MQLELLIEIKTTQKKAPLATLSVNDQSQIITRSSSVTLDVNEADVVTLCMDGKDDHCTVIDDSGNIVEDVAVVLSGLFLENVNYQHHLYFLPCYDDLDNEIPSNPYLAKNGCIKINLYDLIHNVDMDFSNIKYMTLPEIAFEVLGRPTTIDLPDNHKILYQKVV